MKKCIADYPRLQESVDYAAYDGGAIVKDVHELIHKELTPDEETIAEMGEYLLEGLQIRYPAFYKTFPSAEINPLDPCDQAMWGKGLVALYVWVGRFCGY